MIESTDGCGTADEIFDAIDVSFDDLSYLEESQSNRYIVTRYYSRVGGPQRRGTGRLDVEVFEGVVGPLIQS